MANLNTVFGARYLQDPFGGSTSGKLMPFAVVATDAAALFVGDFVTLTGEGSATDYPELGILPVVAQTAATDVIVGVVEGFGVDPSSLEKIYRPTLTLRTVWVRVNPDAWFTIQSTGTVVAADIGQCADITVAAGNTFTGMSGMQLDHATLGAGSAQLKIVGIAPGSELGTYTKLMVMINEHAYRVTTGV